MRFIPPSDYTNNIYKSIQKLREQVDILRKELEELKEQKYDEDLYDLLKKERNAIAIERNVPSYCILNNETIKEISRKKPLTKDDLWLIKGVKDAKIEQFGEIIIQTISSYLKPN